MSVYDDIVRELRPEFLRSAGTRLDTMRGALANLTRAPDDQTALREIYQAFHAFAGSGATYGLPQVSTLGREGEALCSEPIGLDALRAMTQVAERIASEVRSIDATPGGGSPERPLLAPTPVAPRGRLLVVDADPAIQGLLSAAGQHEALTVTAEGSIAGARTVLAFDGIPDALIVGVMLPDGNGYSLVSEVRQRPGGEDAAILIVSARGDLLDKVEAIHCGADGYFQKPLDVEAVMRRIETLIERGSVTRGRVLCVDDDPQQASFVRAVLEPAGCEVRVCDDPRAFEAELTAFRPDVVLMDIVMPRLSGIDLTRIIRQDDRYATLPVIFLTTQREMQTRLAAIRAGGDEHLYKPVSPALLLATVVARLERARVLSSLISHDGLTRLLTHSAFIEQARALHMRFERHPDRSCAWVMADLNLFKSINDRFGHPTGDRVLTALASLLRQRLRRTDRIGRYGGEEFAVLLEDLSPDEAMALVERLRVDFADLTHPDGQDGSFTTTLSAGVANLVPGMTFDGWREAADRALYRAKREGRNRVVQATD